MKIDAGVTASPAFSHTRIVLIVLFAWLLLAIVAATNWVADAESDPSGATNSNLSMATQAETSTDSSPRFVVNSIIQDAKEDFNPFIDDGSHLGDPCHVFANQKLIPFTSGAAGQSIQTGGGCSYSPATMTVRVSYPTVIQYSGALNGPGNVPGTSATGFGSNAMISFSQDLSSSRTYGGSSMYMFLSIPGQAASLPDTPQIYQAQLQGTFTRNSTVNTARASVDLAPVYIKPKFTTSTVGPLSPEDLISYKLELPAYPHFTTEYGLLKIRTPGNTSVVTSSLTGAQGATTITPIGTNGASGWDIYWDHNPGNRVIEFQSRVNASISPAVTEINFASNPNSLAGPNYEFRVRSGSETATSQIYTPNLRIPVRPTLGLSLSTDRRLVAVGDEFTLRGRLTNLMSSTMTNARLETAGSSIVFAGEGLAELVQPVSTTTLGLAPGASGDLEYRFRATRAGKLTVSGRAIATVGFDSARSKLESTPEICVGCDEVELDIEVEKTDYNVGDEFPITVKVKSNRQDSVRVTFEDPVLKERPLDDLPANALLTVDPPTLPEPFDLTPTAPSRSFTGMARLNKLGIAEVVTSLSYTAQGVPSTPLTKTKKIFSSVFKVTVEVTPTQTKLNQTPPEKKTEGCRTLEVLPLVDNCIELVARVKNISDKTITNVRIPSADSVLDLIKETNPKLLGEPLSPVEHRLPEPSPLTLETEQEATWIWRLDAFGAPAALKFEPTVFGVIDGAEVGGHGSKEFKIFDKVLLKWGMRPTDGRLGYPSGSSVRADGFIENVSAESGDEEDLLVMVYQTWRGNVGGGFVFDSAVTGETPEYYKIFQLPAKGDAKRVSLAAIFRTVRSLEATTGDIGFGIRVWKIEEEGLPTQVSEQAELDDENYTDGFTVSLSPEEIIVDDYEEECLAEGYLPIHCAFNAGIGGPFTDSVYGLWQFGFEVMSGLKEGSENHAQISTGDAFALSNAMRAPPGSPPYEEAKQILMSDAYQEYMNYHQNGILLGQLPGQIAMTYEEFSIQTWDSVGRFFQDVEGGDINAVQKKVGYFFGSNPDLLIEPLAAGMTLLKLRKTLRKTGGTLDNNVVTAQLRADGVRRRSTLDERLATAEADPNVTELSTVLESGDILTARHLLKVYGVDWDTYKRLEDFARKNKIILFFRSRSDISQSLLNRGLAWPKPQALKHKTVSFIDQKYFGYRSESKGILEIVEPPSSIKGKTNETGLQAALDSYMDDLANHHPELDLPENQVLRGEVRDRLEKRAEEWNKYCPQLELSDTPGGISEVDVGVSFEAPMQSAHDVQGDVAPLEYRKVKTVNDGFVQDLTGEQRRVWTLDMRGPGNGDYRAVTGDIDFLAMLDEQGRFIQDYDKRFALYKALSQMGFMEHGESITFRLENPRLEHLNCCVEGVPGSDAMVSVGGWSGGPRAARFVPNLTAMNEFNAAWKRVRRQEVVLDKAGEVVYDELGRPKTITVRMENTTGEFGFTNGTPLIRNAGRNFINTFEPTLMDTMYQYFLARARVYFPFMIAIRMTGEEEVTNAATGTSNAVFARGGPVIQLESVADIELRRPTELRDWTFESGWQPITPEEAVAKGIPGVPDLAPFTFLRNLASPGTSQLEINSLAELRATGDFLQASDWIVLNPGGPNQETVQIASMDPLTLTAPVRLEHLMGEMVAWIEQPAASATVAGFVRTPQGRGIANVEVVITDGVGVSRVARTNTFGRFKFGDVQTGQAYTIEARSRRYEFGSQKISVSGDVTDIEIVPLK